MSEEKGRTGMALAVPERLVAVKTKGRRRCAAREREQDIVNGCLQLLTLRGFLAFRNNTGRILLDDQRYGRRVIRMGRKGAPDIVACAPDGRYVAVECKTGRGRLTAEQKVFLKEVEKRGGLAVVVRDIGELDEFLRRHFGKAGG